MKVPLSWLKEYVNIAWPLDRLLERMAMAGMEADSVQAIDVPNDRPHWDPETIVVGEVVEVQRHPNADRLVLATVNHGGSGAETVVTGAPNLHPGDTGIKVAFARRGARLYDGHQDGWHLATLKPSKIRGVRSEAMICSEKELGLTEAHEQVLLLPDDAPVGRPLADYLELEEVAPPDVVVDFSLTPNLARCYSVIGLAREIAALTGQELRVPKPVMRAAGPAIAGQIRLEIDAPDLCNRYSATLTRGVRIGPSPYVMQRRLALCGMRPISNIVDITNYVMLEWGQPLHAFDYRQIRPAPGSDLTPAIIVRRAHPGETMTTLDGQVRQLTTDMLLITDGGGPVGIAGVMGGLESEVTSGTQDVLLESANFHNINIRKTSQALKLSSEAGLRFGRGVPAEMTIPAVTRATELMRLHANGTIAGGIADVYPTPQKRPEITISPVDVERTVGVRIETDEIEKMLESLEFTCERNGDSLQVTPPFHRLDIGITADLIEDVARVYGYERLPLTLMNDELPVQRRNPLLEWEEKVRDVLVGAGLDEVITYSLTGKQTLQALELDQGSVDEAAYLKIANPLSSEREYMRRTLMGSLLETMRDNLRFVPRVAVFELGRVYWPRGERELPEEPRRLGIALVGPRDERSWAGDTGPMDFYDLKGAVEAVLDALGIEGATFEAVQEPGFHPGRTARLMIAGQPAGVMGEVHPGVAERFDLPLPGYVGELDLGALVAHAVEARRFKPIYRFPAVSQDIAVLVDDDTPAGDVRRAIVEAGGELLVAVTLFDVFRGERIGTGKKSLAYALTYQAQDRTLTDAEVGRVQECIVERLEREFGAVLRS